jgi:hypothetical protein
MSNIDILIKNNDCCHYDEIIRKNYDLVTSDIINDNTKRVLLVKKHLMKFTIDSNKKIIDTTYEEVLNHKALYEKIIFDDPNIEIMIFNNSGVDDNKIIERFYDFFKFKFGVYH